MFKNVRLVCRLRKSSPTRSPTLPPHLTSAMSPSQTVVNTDKQSNPEIPPLSDKGMESMESKSAENTPGSSSTPANAPQTNRYFIMKSLAKEDLAWSVTNKVWATQLHNEIVLNEAFKVYPFQTQS